MREFIKSKLETVYDDFCDAASESEGLCKLKKFSFAGGVSPDYSDPLVRKYYMLKYFPGYLAEYYLMYEDILEQGFIKSKVLDILSLGCGCGVDYWGFHYIAKNKLKNHQKTTSYTGYYITEWEYRDKIENEHVFFENENIGELEELDYDRYNVIVFPKSISDFPDDAFDNFITAIENTKFKRKRIIIACSFMTNDSMKYDFSRLSKVVKTMTAKHGYKCHDKLNGYRHMEDQDVGLNTVVPGFDYTLNIKSTICSTLEHCPNYIENGESCDNKCTVMNQWPILKTRYVNYAIRRLSRKAK